MLLTSCGGQRGSPGGLSMDMFQHTRANGLKEGGGKSSDRKEEEDDLFFLAILHCMWDLSSPTRD